MKKKLLLLGISSCLSAGLATADTKPPVEAKGADVATELPEVNVVSEKQQKKAPTKSKSRAEQDKLPQTTESVTIQKLEETNNGMNTADMVKYMPSVAVRKRYVGDTFAPLQTRTTTMSQSARSLIYADGILLSALIGNNNGNGSPLWDTVAPSEVERIDMMYGPFSAAYAGNSVGGVLDITTKMPTKFEASANVQAQWQDYNFFGQKSTYDSQQYSMNLGDKHGDFSWRFNYAHLDSNAQPIAYSTATATAAAGTYKPVTGAVTSTTPYGQSEILAGATSITHTLQDTLKLKLAYDITPSIKAAYTVGLWLNDANTQVNTFLRDSAGNPVYGGLVSANGQKYNVATMAGGLADQRRWSHGLSIKQDTGGLFDWSLNASLVDYGKDIAYAPSGTPANTSTGLPGAPTTNVLGKNTVLTGTGWHTVDAKGIWRPKTGWADHEVSLGFHHDYYELNQPVYNTTGAVGGSMQSSINNTSLNSGSFGKTQTNAVWLQDILDFNSQWRLTLGGRLENWNGYDGRNISTTGTAGASMVTVNQSALSALKFSPKASLRWAADDNWQVVASIGHAYRFPTVSELYSSTGTVTTGVANISNPNLKPENSLSSELATTYATEGGKIRLSFFQERTNNLINSQTTSSTGVFNGSAYQYLTTTQNIGQVNTYGIELAGEKKEIGKYFGVDGLDFSANGTWVDSRITKDGNNGMIVTGNPLYNSASTCPGVYSATAKNCQVNVVGNRQPRLPEFRASATATYRPIQPLTLSTSLRYSSQQYGQLDNSDIAHMSYTGLGSYFVVDTRFRYEITKQLALSGGIDNINNDRYILYHPFPGRTYQVELKFNY